MTFVLRRIPLPRPQSQAISRQSRRVLVHGRQILHRSRSVVRTAVPLETSQQQRRRPRVLRQDDSVAASLLPGRSRSSASSRRRVSTSRTRRPILRLARLKSRNPGLAKRLNGSRTLNAVGLCVSCVRSVTIVPRVYAAILRRSQDLPMTLGRIHRDVNSG